jgi:threonine aldolase
MFHQFFGENLLRADVCNSVDELGQLLDHSGPVAASERNAARIFNADELFFVTNGTSTSNKMVWHANVAPGDIVVADEEGIVVVPAARADAVRTAAEARAAKDAATTLEAWEKDHRARIDALLRQKGLAG